jgi:hypothetical protein
MKPPLPPVSSREPNFRELSRWFRRSYRGYALGPFTAPRAEGLQRAHRAGRLLLEDGAALLIRNLPRPAALTDFAGRQVVAQTSGAVVSELAGIPSGIAASLERLARSAGGRVGLNCLRRTRASAARSRLRAFVGPPRASGCTPRSEGSTSAAAQPS